MERKWRIGLALLGVVVAATLLSPLYERFFGRKRLRFPYLSRPIPAEQYTVLASKPGWSKAELEVAPGLQLRGLVRRPSSKTAPWVLFYPGNDESQLERGQGFLVGLGAEQDWGLAVFAYRGYDASDGKSELAGIRADAPEIFAKLCALEGLRPDQVHIAGFSIGGHFAVHAAGVAAERGQRAATLTLLASVNDIIMYQPSPWEKLSAGEDYQTQPYLGRIPPPVLVVQGAGDQTLDGVTQGKAIAQTLGDRAKYVELAGVGHIELLADSKALEAVRAFVTESSR